MCISEGFTDNFNSDRWDALQKTFEQKAGRYFTFQAVPEAKESASSVQLGLFDVAPAQNNDHASAYLESFGQICCRWFYGKD